MVKVVPEPGDSGVIREIQASSGRVKANVTFARGIWVLNNRLFDFETRQAMVCIGTPSIGSGLYKKAGRCGKRVAPVFEIDQRTFSNELIIV
ncbi:MAG: hypothetical protein P8M80_05540 [Pirellulaceae bacterium]|nr:hypothetical protein [Pirellulaceae bacterium]